MAQYMRFLCLISLCFALPSCVTLTAAGVYSTYHSVHRNIYVEDAMHGDADAQYKLGQSYCCGSNTIFNNREALRWMCMAAKSGHAEAAETVAGIYSSDKSIFYITDLAKRISHRNESTALPEDDAVALAWYAISHQLGNVDAAETIDKMEAALDAKTQNRAKKIVANYPNLPCELTQQVANNGYVRRKSMLEP